MESQNYELEEGEIIDEPEVSELAHHCKHEVKTILKDKKNKHSSKLPKNFLHDKCNTCCDFVKYKVTKKCPYHKISSHNIKHKIHEKRKHYLQKMRLKKSLYKIQNYNKLLNQNPLDLKTKVSNNESEVSSTSKKDENSENICKKIRHSNENFDKIDRYKLTQNNCKCIKENNPSLRSNCNSHEDKFKTKIKSSLIIQNVEKDDIFSQIDQLTPKINNTNSSNHICLQNDDIECKEDIAPDSTTKQSDFDSEDDEEELRRKALASCSQRTSSNYSNFELATSLTNENFNDSCSSDTFIHDQTSDDYHVIDMDVDQDCRDVPIKIENMEQNDMFVLDSSPISPLEINDDDKNEIIATENKFNHSFHHDDFEETLLRAQLILSMQKNQKRDKNIELENNSLHNLNNNQDLKNNIPQKDKNSSVSNKNVLEKVPLQQNITKDKEIEEIKPRKPPQRIVITLADDSSDDSEIDDKLENEDSEPENKNKTNIGSNASIDQLITNARKKSDELNMDHQNNVPLAVSCLSKAQQEEYNKLKKILAQKQSFQLKNLSSQELNEKKLSPQELNEKKLKQAKLALEKEMKHMSLLKDQVNKKKLVHDESKLVLERAMQHFLQAKEQLNSSRKTEKTNEQLFKKSLTQFHQSQKEINQLQKLVIDLQKKCSKQDSSNDKL